MTANADNCEYFFFVSLITFAWDINYFSFNSVRKKASRKIWWLAMTTEFVYFCFVLVTNRQCLVSRICITLCPLIMPQSLSLSSIISHPSYHFNRWLLTTWAQGCANYTWQIYRRHNLHLSNKIFTTTTASRRRQPPPPPPLRLQQQQRRRWWQEL